MRLLPFLMFTLILLASCSKKEYYIREKTKLNITEEVIVFNYDRTKSSDYLILDYTSDPLQRVFWTSPDTFNTIMILDTVKTVIANYSTYTKEDGTGHQGVYISPQHIGRTVTVIGYTDEYDEINIRDTLKIQIR